MRLREIEFAVAQSDMPPKVRRLRTNKLKRSREMRDAALFCYGMGQRMRTTVFLAESETQDYDFVASWIVEGVQNIAPVQLKEAVPNDLNPSASVQMTIDSLSKYADSGDLTVVIRLNQRRLFDPDKLIIPTLQIASLWTFGAVSADASEWILWGNFLEECQGTRFVYPT